MMHIIRITKNCSISSAKRTCERTIGKVAGGKKVYAYEVLRSDYESIDVRTGKINGSFDVDSNLVLIKGRPAKSRAEIIAYNEAYNAGSSWTDSGNWG